MNTLVMWIILLFSATLNMVAQDTSCGIIWHPAIQLSDSTHSAYGPILALSGDDTVHVTWWEDPPGLKLPYVRSVTGGGSFQAIREMLTDSIAYPNEAFRPFIVADHEKVYLLFITAASSPVRLLSSSDGGSTFGSVRDISVDRASEITWATISGDTIALIYPPDPPSYRRILRSTNRGITWSLANHDLGFFARIVLTPATLHLVQHGGPTTAAEIQYKRSTNLGDTWEKGTLLSTNDTLFSDIPTIAAYQTKCGTELLVAWRDAKYGCTSCFLGASIIGRAGLRDGDVWLPENILTPQPNGTEPRAALHGNIRAVIWDEEIVPTVYHVDVRASNNSITQYCPRADLTPTDGIPPGPLQVAVSTHAVHVVFEQAVGNRFGIFYRRGEFIQSNASFSLATGLLAMDSTEINKTRTDSVPVTNIGTDPLVIGTATSDDENFSVTPESYTIPPTASHSFAIHFTPQSFGFHNGKIMFYHNGQSSPDCFQVTGVGKYTLDTIRYKAGAWNMVSAPVKSAAQTALPSLFSYEGGYSREYSMTFGPGYWAKPESARVVYRGSWAVFDSVQVKKGWNMIGGLSVPMPGVYIYPAPDSIYFQSQYFNYNDTTGYNRADTLFPGKSYWVKMSGDGKLVLDARFLPPAQRQKAINWKGEKTAKLKTRLH